jgi:hypothetical protein
MGKRKMGKIKMGKRKGIGLLSLYFFFGKKYFVINGVL